MTLGVFYSLWPPGLSMATPSNGRLKAKWRKLLFLKSNPRDLGYTQRLFEEHHPGGALLDATKGPDWSKTIGTAEKVVLLSPGPDWVGFRAA
jgi:hypothetical protein